MMGGGVPHKYDASRHRVSTSLKRCGQTTGARFDLCGKNAELALMDTKYIQTSRLAHNET